MFKVIVHTFGEAMGYTWDTLEEAQKQIATLHELFKGAGQIPGQDYEIEFITK